MSHLNRGFDKQPLYVQLILILGMPIAVIGPFMLLNSWWPDRGGSARVGAIGLVGFFPALLAAGCVLGLYASAREIANASFYRRELEKEKRQRADLQKRQEAAAAAEGRKRMAEAEARDRQNRVAAIKSFPAAVVTHYRKAAEAIQAASDAQREAEAHFALGAYTPFWECIEYSLDRLTSHRKEVASATQVIASHTDAMRRLISEYPDQEPEVAGAVIPQGVAEIGRIAAHDVISRRIAELTYEAQKDRDFAFIYEQRRTTAAVFQAFRSVAHAVSLLTAEIGAANRELVEAIRDAKPVPPSNYLVEPTFMASPSSLVGQVAQLNETMRRIAD